jgi:hypothetical protein
MNTSTTIIELIVSAPARYIPTDRCQTTWLIMPATPLRNSDPNRIVTAHRRGVEELSPEFITICYQTAGCLAAVISRSFYHCDTGLWARSEPIQINVVARRGDQRL